MHLPGDTGHQGDEKIIAPSVGAWRDRVWWTPLGIRASLQDTFCPALKHWQDRHSQTRGREETNIPISSMISMSMLRSLNICNAPVSLWYCQRCLMSVASTTLWIVYIPVGLCLHPQLLILICFGSSSHEGSVHSAWFIQSTIDNLASAVQAPSYGAPWGRGLFIFS